jgi:Cu(I)/Ag(I) efflux system membrane fusion protein
MPLAADSTPLAVERPTNFVEEGTVGVPAMRTTSVLLSLAICSASLSFSGSGLLRHAAADAAAAAAAAAVQYRCPMHPTFVQDRRGDCPVCGMKLVPVKPAPAAPAANGASPADRGSAERGPSAESAAAAMRIGADKQKVLGIVATPVQRSAGSRTLRVLGRVALDETRLYKLNAGVGGSIRDVSHVATGSRVRKGQVLGSFYAPDTLSVLQLFILNNAGYDRFKLGTKPDGSREGEGKGEDEADVRGNRATSGLKKANIQQRIMQLENYGVSELQRDEIAREGRVPDTIKIVAPASGFVLARNVFPGLKFDRGFEFYRIADLRKIWVLADVSLQDARHVRIGMRAEVSVPEQQVALPATVTEILPQFDAATRALKVKLALDNPGYVLRPDMFVDVALKVDLPAAVVIPSDAIVDSGLVKRVFVRSGEGVFEPRAVETGWRSGDQVEVVKGLGPGELVVTSGTFFLDSETRMRPPPSGAAAPNGETPVPTGHPSRGGAGDPIEARASAAREETPHLHAGDAR